MTSFAFKSLLSRKLRTALTAIAIVLGVAMVSGTLVLTDSIDKAFNLIFTRVRQGLGRGDQRQVGDRRDDKARRSAPTVDQSLLAKVRRSRTCRRRWRRQRRGVADRPERQGDRLRRRAEPRLQHRSDPDPPFNPLTLVGGSWPGPGEVVIDESTAGQEAPRGRRARSACRPRARSNGCASPGIVKFGSVSAIGGATLAGFELATAQRPVRQAGAVRRDPDRRESRASRRDAPAAGAVDPAADGTQVRTGTAQAREDAKHTDSFISFLRTSCSRSAASRSSSARFVIANSLSITIAQRTREFATAAHARRVAAPGAGLDRDRGTRDRRRSPRSSVSFLGLGPRQGALQAVRRGRVHAPEQRHRVRRRGRS